ncbi:MAG TPA: hypothetical protein VFL74_05310 [Sphingomicrobium sp.]|nr:hypothetical protein [Sphingomicrobium sp.]
MADNPHPPGFREKLAAAVESVRRRRDSMLSVHAKACFLDPGGKGLSFDGERLLADLRNKAKLFGSSITRDLQGRIDTEEMLRMEGRREIVLRLINLLELDPQEVARLVEVDDGRN